MLSTRSMKMRRVAFGVLLFVSADFGNPFMGAAFTFDPNSSIEVHHQRERVSGDHVSVVLPRVLLPVLATSRSLAPARRPERHWHAAGGVPALPRGHTSSDDPPVLSEDH
jgi:hypothetical protein